MSNRVRWSVVGGIVAALLLLLLLPHGDPHQVDLGRPLLGPSAAHPLGTDQLGRDLWSRMAVGLQRTLTVMVVATSLSVVVGTVLGVLAGYAQGAVKAVIMMVTDLIMIVPTFVGALIFAALFGLTPLSAGVIVGLLGIGPYVNQACALTQTLRGRAFVETERLLGTPLPRVLSRHIVPTVMAHLRPYLGASAASAVLAYAGLAFIGLGVDTTTPDWGTMLYDYRVHLSDQPLLLLWPCLGIALLALGAHVLFDRPGGEQA